MGTEKLYNCMRWNVLVVLSWALVSSIGMFPSNAGFISIPAEQYLDSNPNQELTTFVLTNALSSPRKSRAFRGQEQNGPSDEQQDVQTSLSPIESSIRIQIDEVVPDCGNSRLDVDPVNVTNEATFEWQTQSTDITPLTQGPCEVWIDNTLQFQKDDCSKVFPGTIEMDYSGCQGDCVLRFYWLFMSESSHGAALKHCVPIRFGGKSSDSSSEFQNSSDSSSGSDTSGSASGFLDPDDVQPQSQSESQSESAGRSASSSSNQFGTTSSSSASAENDGYEQLEALQALSDIQDAAFRNHHRLYSKAYDLGFANAFNSMWKQQHTDHTRSRQKYHYSSSIQTKSEARTCLFTGTAFTCSSTEKIVVQQYIDG
ncbi:hypothetical protein FI667_g4080, partial [Globisporangium splendens]